MGLLSFEMMALHFKQEVVQYLKMSLTNEGRIPVLPVSYLEVVVVAVAGRRWRLYPEDVAEVDAHKVAAVGFEGAETARGGVQIISQTETLTV